MQLSTHCIDFKCLRTSILVSHSFVIVSGSSFMTKKSNEKYKDNGLRKKDSKSIIGATHGTLQTSLFPFF